MKIAAVIAEYNPMHEGHIYLINEAIKKKKVDYIICILSSDFTQRGEPSVLDKFKRSEFALKAGFNLVIELPFRYSAQSADLFAYGGIKILNTLNCVDYIFFGIENKINEDTKKIVEILTYEPEQYKNILTNEIDKGTSFAAARQLALEKILEANLDFINNPNNILAIEYLKWLKKLNSNISPVPILREGSGYNDIKKVEKYPSSTYMRNLLSQKKYNEFLSLTPQVIKEETNKEIKNKFVTNDLLWEATKSAIITADKKIWANTPDMEIGLENRILSATFTSHNLDDLITKTTTKRITKNRIRRILLYLLTGYTLRHREISKTSDLEYIHILAFDNKGREIIKYIKEKSNISPLIKYDKSMKKLNSDERYLFEKEIQIANLYESMGNKNYNKDFYTTAFYLDR